MRFRTVLVSLAILAAASVAAAQTKISGSAHCEKGDPMYMIEVEKPTHMIGVGKSKCSWTKPLEIEGVKSKDGFSVSADETNGNKYTGSGYHWSTMDNGDKFHVSFNGKATMKDKVPENAEGKWHFTSGTGKLKGIKGSGTYKGHGNADGSADYEVEGEYQISKK